MQHKKAILIGGGVAAGAVLIYLLTRRRAVAASPQGEFTPAPTAQDDPTTFPWAELGNEFLNLLKKRRSNTSNTSAPTEAAVSQPSFLKRGSKGSKVVALQKWLNQSSGAGLVTDGDFGPSTEAAVKREQDPFSVFEGMYPNSIYGQVSKTFYDLFIKSFE